MKKLFQRGTALAVLASMGAFASAEEVITLPALDLSNIHTWIIGIGATMLMITASIYGIRRANGFLGRQYFLIKERRLRLPLFFGGVMQNYEVVQIIQYENFKELIEYFVISLWSMCCAMAFIAGISK